MPKKEIDKQKRVKIQVPCLVPQEVSVQEIENRISDLVQHIANTQAEIDGLKAQKALAEIEAIK